tara:strand:+ start:4040 stop:5782 length:1743 start_codon:yes stop_codon:yes gene_type:complete
MSSMSDTKKVDFLFKKILNRPTTLPGSPYYQEPTLINNITINGKQSVFSNKQYYRDKIPNVVPVELVNVLLDDDGNTMEGSSVGKLSNNTIIRKFVKLELTYVIGSKVVDNSNNILSIAFFSNNLVDSIPFNYDPLGSYLYEIYRNNGTTLINYDEGDWVLDNDTGILTFYSKINEDVSSNNYVTELLSPKISFYKYVGVIGMEPISFLKNELVTINANVNIKHNLIINNDLVIYNNTVTTNNLYANTIQFKEYAGFPNNNNMKEIRYVDNSLYFYNNNRWRKLINEDFSIYNSEQYVYDSSKTANILDVNKNISIVEIDSVLAMPVFIFLPTVQISGVKKTIIMGQSINNYRNGKDMILYGNFVDVGGIGPLYMNIRFLSSGQNITLVSVVSENTSLYGGGNKYWQIVQGNFHCDDDFQTNPDGTVVNNSINGTYEEYVRDGEYTQFSSTNVDTNVVQNNLLDYMVVNINGANNVSVYTNMTIINFNETLLDNITINLDVVMNEGYKKKIFLGESYFTYGASKLVFIESKFANGYTNGAINGKIKFERSGQVVNLVCLKDTNNVHYWHIISGDYELINN